MGAIRLVGWIIAALAFVVPGRCQEPPREPRPAKARVDFYGDPLPEGAIARLGTVRFRCAESVKEVAFSADGKLLATVASHSKQRSVILWDRPTGRKLREIPVRSIWVQAHLRFSPDGKRLYSSLGWWDVETGADVKDIPRPPESAQTLGYSPDSREILVLHRSEEIARWDVEKGKELGRYPSPGHYLSTATRVGDQLLVPQYDGQSVVVWDVAHQKQLWSVKATRGENDINLLRAFSADGKLLAVETPPRAISVYESVTGKLLRRLDTGVEKVLCSCSISPDARIVAAGYWEDDFLRLFDLDSGRERVKVSASDGYWTSAFFAPDSKTFATGGPNHAHAVLLWETATGKQIDPFPGHGGPIYKVAFSPDGRTAATCSPGCGDRGVRLWDPQNERLLRWLGATNAAGVLEVAFSPDGGRLASCDRSSDQKVRIWDVRTGRELYALAGKAGSASCVAFSPDGKRLASGDAYVNRWGHNEVRLCVWDAESGKLLWEVRGTRGPIGQVAFTGDGRQVLQAAAGGIHVYDADTGQLVGEPLQPKSHVWRLALSADGRLLATSSGDRGPVRLWELASRREVPLALPFKDSCGVSLTPDGRTLAITGPLVGNAVFLFHWPTGQTVGKISSDAGFGLSPSFAPDGRRLATPTYLDSSVLIWDVAAMTNRPLPAVARPDEAELRRWWERLRDDNPGEAYQAVWRFAAVPEQAVPFLAGVLRPAEGPAPEKVARWINDLDSSEFPEREKASRELERVGETAIDALRKARKADISLEQKRRIDQLLAALDGPVPGPEQLRTIRAVAALEHIGSPEARKVLAGLAARTAGTRLTREAKATLERLKRADAK
jgi:WD40 repeat protein